MYHLLPSMNCLFDSTELLFSMMSEYDLHYKDKLNFRIIDTIIYKSGVPISYYYMSDGKILCKNNYKDIQTNLIMTKCINNKHIKTDICALFLNQEIKLKFHDEETNQQVKEIQNITVEHCTSHNLNYYLIHKQKQSTLFQHFVYPIDNKNFIIEVEWNNQIIQLSKRTNLYQLDDRMEQYKKLLTFEKNCDQHVFANNVSHERIVKHISEVCKIIKKRVNTINHYKYILTNFGEHRTKERKFIEEAEKKEILKSMILHFKIDEDCNIYLLYCVNMEFKESYFKSTGKEKLVFAVHFKVPDEIMCEKVPLDQAKKHNFSKKAELEGRILCLNCNRFVRKVNMYKIKYDFIIRNNDRKYGPNSVPIIFRRINNNKLKDEMYFKFKNYPDFLDHDADLCDECYIEHTEFIKTKIKIDNNYKVKKCPIVKEEIVIESDKFIDIKDRKEFLKCQIQLTEKNPDFQKKFNNNEKKSQDKNVKFTKLVDLNYEKTKNFSLESLQKKLAKSLKINSDLNSKDDKEIFIDNLLRSKSKIDAMQKESQFGFCKNLLKYYDKKEVSNSIKKMKYLDLVKNFDTDFLIQTDLGSKAANDHNEIKKLPDSLNKIMKVEKVDVNPKGRNYFSQLDHFRSHNQSPATTIFSKDNNKIPTHNDFLHYKSFRIKNEQLKKDNINEEIANNVKYLDIENKTFHKRINSTILSHKTDNYIFTKPNTPLITAIEGVSKIKEIVKNKGKGELIISHKKSKTVNTGSNESTKDILDNYSNLTKYSSLIEGLKKSLNSRKKTIK